MNQSDHYKKAIDNIESMQANDSLAYRSILIKIAKSNPSVFNSAFEETPRKEAPRPPIGIRLISCGNRKIQVIKEIRAITGLGLKEAKELVDLAPSNIFITTYSESVKAKRMLEEAGATIEFIY